MARTRTRASAAESQQLSSPPATPAPTKKRATPKSKQTKSPAVKTEEGTATPATPTSTSRKRTRATPKQEPTDDELPHNLGAIPTPSTDDAPPSKKRASRSKKEIKVDPEEAEKVASKAGVVDAPTAKKAKKIMNGSYGLTPGQSPYPDYPHPTKEECYEVVKVLEKVHGKVEAPKEIKPPSLEVAGCGEVPSVLDALIRTRLSAATTNLNSSRAFQGLVKTFGVIDNGIGKGSVNWNNVRLAPQKEVFEAIKCGGLADNKSKDIKAILQSVYEENQERSAALKAAQNDKTNGPAGAENEPSSEKNTEISKADSSVLSLDHMHLLSNEEAFNKMIKYPGIGPKTASCVLLFCLQRPSFAVDTHVFRLCKWLGWVPPDNQVRKGEPKVERNTTYSHCEVRIPDELKYKLHYLLIKHGKNCPRCRAATGMSSERWDEGCPIEHLVKRHGAKKGGGGGGGGDGKVAKTTTKTTPKKKGKKVESEDEEEAEMSDVGSEDEGGMSDVGSEDEGEMSDVGSEDED